MEILGGDGLHLAFEELGIDATKTYSGPSHDEEGNEIVCYEVWDLDIYDIHMLGQMSDEEWKPEWGWFRYNQGTNIGDIEKSRETTINNVPITVWTNSQKLVDLRNTEEDKEFGECLANQYLHKEFRSLTDYLFEEFGVTSETNISAITIDLAKLNGLTLAELWRIYQGEE